MRSTTITERASGYSTWRGAIARALLLGATGLALSAASAGATSTAAPGSLTISASGLPAMQGSVTVVSGPGFRRTIHASHATLRGLTPGRYEIDVKPVRIEGNVAHVQAGATAYPTQEQHSIPVRAGKNAQFTARYTAIINPSVQRLPGAVLGPIGNPADPSGLVMPAGSRVPRVGTIFTSGPTDRFPRGLISKVTGTERRGKWLAVDVTSVPIGEAVPALSYAGRLRLRRTTASAGSAQNALHTLGVGCNTTAPLQFGGHLDSVELRQASLGVWPTQLRLTLAVRTTETLGLSAAAVGLNCDWSVDVASYQGVITVGVVPIPVYATVPLKASISVNGTLAPTTINVASTTVATVAAGRDNYASLQEQGANVWMTGSPSVSGSARLSASLGLQAGIGVIKGGDVHVSASFGPQFDWSTGQSCSLVFNLGPLSAGVVVPIVHKTLNTRPFTPFVLPMWTGCAPSGGGSTGSAGGQPAGGGGSPSVTLPGQPTNMSVTSTSASSAALAWTDASNNETGFVSQYRIGSGAWVAGPAVGAGVTSMTVSGLSPGTTYTFQVGAQNSAGTHWSAYFTGTTGSVPTLPAEPTNPGVTSTSTASATFAWTDASNNETGFVSQYKTGSGGWVAGPSVGTDATSMTVSGLSPATTYTFQVGAQNSVGTHWSVYFTGVTAAVPPPPAYHAGRQVTIDSHATGGVSGHTGPDNAHTTGPTYPANSPIWIVCYVNGQSITGPYNTTTIWDLSDDGYYYTDAWLYTGVNTAAVPPCAARSVTIDVHATGGVSGHRGPDNSYATGPTRATNSAITIVCYVDGQSITGPYDTTTIWDLANDGYYYTDAWLYTGVNAAAVPHC